MKLERRPSLAAATAVGLLVLAGCGGSSTASSTTGSSASATQSSSTAASAPQSTSTGASTPQPAESSAVGSARTVSASSGGVTASMHGGTHQPKVEAPWPISFKVTRAGAPAAAAVTYEYMFGGQVVARRSHYTFKGHFADIFKWPSSAVGYPLTFRAVITSGGVTIDLDYPVQVSR